MKKSSKYLPNRFFIKVPGTGKTFLRVPIKVKPAKKGARFYRTINHCKAGIQGECATCANSEAAVDAGLGVLAQFTDSRACIVDKLDKRGTPIEGTLYEHRQSSFQKRFDTDKGALLRSEEAEGWVTLSPISPSHHNRAPNKPRGPRENEDKSGSKMSKGAMARAKRSGVTIEAP